MLHSTMSHHFATFEAVACRAVVPATFQGDAFLFMCFFVNNQHSFLAQPAATHQCSHQILQMIPLNCPAITTTFINVCMSTHIIYIDYYYVSYFINPPANSSYRVGGHKHYTEASILVRLTLRWNPGPRFCSLNLWISFYKGVILVMLAHHEDRSGIL